MTSKFPQDIDLLLELGDVLGVVSEHDTLAGKLFPLSAAVAAGTEMSLGFTPGSNADLSVGSLSNDQIAVQQIGGSSLGGRRFVGRWGLGSNGGRWIGGLRAAAFLAVP